MQRFARLPVPIAIQPVPVTFRPACRLKECLGLIVGGEVSAVAVRTEMCPIFADVRHVAAMKEKYGDRISLLGNIDCGSTLSEVPVSQEVAEVKEAIRPAGPGGGYMLMSSNSIHSSVRPENYRAMVETTREFGRYPLGVAALA